MVYGSEFASMGQPVPELVPVLVMRCPTDNRLVLDFFRFFWSAAQSTTGTRDVTFFACSLSQEAVAGQNSARSKNGVLEDRSLDASTHPPSRTTSRKK